MARIPIVGFIFKCDSCSNVSKPYYLPKTEDIDEHPLPEGWEIMPNSNLVCDQCKSKENGV